MVSNFLQIFLSLFSLHHYRPHLVQFYLSFRRLIDLLVRPRRLIRTTLFWPHIRNLFFFSIWILAKPHTYLVHLETHFPFFNVIKTKFIFWIFLAQRQLLLYIFSILDHQFESTVSQVYFDFNFCWTLGLKITDNVFFSKANIWNPFKDCFISL